MRHDLVGKAAILAFQASVRGRALAAETRRQFFDPLDQCLQFLDDALMQLHGKVGILLENAPEHLAVETQNLRIDGCGGTGQAFCIGDQRQLAQDRAGSRVLMTT